jgi:hypothetical protein
MQVPSHVRRLAALISAASLPLLGFVSCSGGGGGGQDMDVFLIDPALEPDGNGDPLRFEEVSILSDFAVVCRLEGLTEGASYKVAFTVRDGEGNSVEAPAPVTLTSNGSSDLAWFTLPGEPSAHAPGTWEVAADIEGFGRTAGTFVLLPPNPADQSSLAQHERARENVFSAFASYWTAVAEDPPTFLVGLSPSGDQARPTAPPGFADSFAKPGTQDAPALGSDDYLEISGVDYHFVSDHVSDADKLNGISYRGRAAFSISVYRRFSPETGWSKWTDIDRDYSDISAAASDLVGLALEASSVVEGKRVLFYSSPLTPALRYEVWCQDGNWFVVSDRQDLSVNGVRRGSRKPEILEIHSPTLTGSSGLFQPSLEAALQLAKEGASPRAVARQLGSSVSSGTDRSKIQNDRTKTLLRGRALNR